MFLTSVCFRFGRRNAFISALVLALPLGVALCFSPGYLSFLAIRIVYGAALAGIFLSFYIASKCNMCTARRCINKLSARRPASLGSASLPLLMLSPVICSGWFLCLLELCDRNGMRAAFTPNIHITF